MQGFAVQASNFGLVSLAGLLQDSNCNKQALRQDSRSCELVQIRPFYGPKTDRSLLRKWFAQPIGPSWGTP
jgi:hypothetical protein